MNHESSNVSTFRYPQFWFGFYETFPGIVPQCWTQSRNKTQKIVLITLEKQIISIQRVRHCRPKPRQNGKNSRKIFSPRKYARLTQLHVRGRSRTSCFIAEHKRIVNHREQEAPVLISHNIWAHWLNVTSLKGEDLNFMIFFLLENI